MTNIIDSVRLPIVVEWRRGDGPARQLIRIGSSADRLLPRIPGAMVIGGIALLVAAVSGDWAPRWAEPASEAGTAIAVVGLLAVNAHLARTGKGRAFWYAIGCVLGAAGCAVVLSGLVHDERWISVISHLAVGLLAFVLLETFFVAAFALAREWSASAGQELVVTIGSSANAEIRQVS